MRWSLLAAAALATPAIGQDNVAYERQDARIEAVEYDQSTPVDIAPGNALTLLVPPGERVLDIRLDDPHSFQVSVSSSSDTVWIWPLGPTSGTQMSIRTDKRDYSLSLVEVAGPAPYVLRLVPPLSAAAALQPAKVIAGPMLGRYKLRGNRALRPSAIGDDGVHTYISWGEGVALPAVFAVDAFGNEQMVNGYMRDGQFVIDGVSAKLVFRIDRQSAVAVRSSVEK